MTFVTEKGGAEAEEPGRRNVLDRITQTACKQGKELAKMDTNLMHVHQNVQMHTHLISVNIQLHQGSIIISKTASHLLLA